MKMGVRHTGGISAIKKQERRLKRRHTLGGLEIIIRHQTVNTLELSAPPPPPPKKKKWWSFKQQLHVASKKNGRTVKQSHCETV